MMAKTTPVQWWNIGRYEAECEVADGWQRRSDGWWVRVGETGRVRAKLAPAQWHVRVYRG